ncbi:MAG TPA: DUF6702 family protein [Gemmatimonadales bacterium]|nr:DUF6702 family protein [Gemmatimonadales bacterium]
MTRTWPRMALLGLCVLPMIDHPLHTTLTEVTQSGPEISITVRGFVDDLALAATGRPSGMMTTASADSSIGRYLLRNLVLAGPGVSRVPLAWRGVRHQADVAWFTYTGRLERGLSGARIGVSALCELYDDQVNIVQVTIGGSRRSLLFTPGDRAKEIR